VAGHAALFQLLASEELDLIGSATGSGGVEIGGTADVDILLYVGVATGSGGVEIGGAASVKASAPQAASDIIVEWDFDNDGDFDEPGEDITAYVLSAETFTGRDWPSLLTGKSGPGKLRLSLRNDDDRFSYFNASSPLNAAPFSLKTGRKVRVRTAGAANPDPATLTRDRFRRANGPLGSEEGGLTYVEPLANDFTIESSRAVATSEGNTHIAVVDVGTADYYVQAQISVLGIIGNEAGIVYRYVDSDNYSVCVLDVTTSSLRLVNVVAGVEFQVAGLGVEVYSGATIGVLVEGSIVVAYLEGVPLFVGTTINESAESVGIYAEWFTDDNRPEIDNLYAWAGLPEQVEGVLWTGDIAEVAASVSPGPEKIATLTGEGWLSKLATQHISPPASITGRKTGLLVGNVLAGSNLLHPPGVIDEGDVSTGAFALDGTSAMEVARRVEETEFGFLYEAQEGPISFASRSARDGALALAAFTDAPGGQFGYHRLEPYDWRREVFNRVVAGVSPWLEGAEAILFTDPGPYSLASGETQALQAAYDGTVVRWTGHTRNVAAPGPPTGISVDVQSSSSASGTFDVAMPSTVNAGDLLLIVCSVTADWPEGWSFVSYSPLVLAKIATGVEGGTNVALAAFGDFPWAVQVIHVTGWHGSLDGIAVGGFTGGADTSPNPPSLAFPWGALPALVIAAYQAEYEVADGSVSHSGIPSGYTNGESASAEDDLGDGITYGMIVGTAQRQVNGLASENPGTFALSASTGDYWVDWDARTIAIRGPATGAVTPVTGGTPSGANPEFTIGYVASLGGTTQVHENIEVTGVPLVQGDQQLVQADDFSSQDEHNAIRTYTNPANLFATSTDAQVYADLVLATHGDDRPIVSLSFYATKSAAYRAQAARRRVGDKIRLVADHNTGFGIDADFFIEAIAHRWSHGTRLWETTWELSPA
jgi:hypothetical protein